MVSGGVSNLTNIVAETLDMKSSLLSVVTIMSVTLNPSSQSAALQCMVFTMPVKGLWWRDSLTCFLLSMAYSCSPLKNVPEFFSPNFKQIFYSSQHAKPLLQLWIEALIKSIVCFLFISCSLWLSSTFFKVWHWHQISICATGTGKQLLEIQWHSTLPVLRHVCNILRSDFALSHLPVHM